MDVLELYQKLQKDTQWIKPAQLKHIRKSLYNMTQVEFAELIGVAYNTYKTWESGRYKPSTPAQALLYIIQNHKEIFLENRHKLLKKLVK